MSDPYAILFVDDEDRVLAGLRRLLRPMRREWDMHFALSGAEALEYLAANPVDVVVSDVRMPGMDGIQLLDEVRSRFPDLIRIILSGHSDQVATLRATGVAHQYLAKPCDPVVLQTAIDRSAALRRDLGDEQVAAAIGGTKSLPPAPKVYDQLTAELAKEEPSLNVVADIVATDPALAAKVLQLVNSAFFALRREVTSVPQAVALLGMKTVVGLTLTVGLFDTPQPSPEIATILTKVRARSMDAANVAKAIALAEGASSADGDAAFLAGILHDCGKLVMSVNWPQEFTRLEQAGATVEAEQASYGLDHARAGGYLLGVWGLPDEIVEAVTYHHAPDRSLDEQFGITAALHAALATMDRVRGGSDFPFDEALIDRLGKADRIPAWIEVVETYEYKKENP